MKEMNEKEGITFVFFSTHDQRVIDKAKEF